MQHTFKQFLKEQDSGRSINPRQWAKQVIENCQPAINQAGGILDYNVYRGVRTSSDSSEDFIWRKTRTNREPRDTENDIHQLMDQWMYEKFGIRFRTSSIIVTGSSQQAQHYGETHLLFPEGQFEFLWSPEVRDIGIRVDVNATKYARKISDDNDHQIQYDQALKQGTHEALNEIKWSTDNFKQALYTGHEIMISVPSYYAADVEANDEDRVRMLLQRFAEK